MVSPEHGQRDLRRGSASVACCSHSPASGPERVRTGQSVAVAEQGQEAVRLGVGVGVRGRLGTSDSRRCAERRLDGADRGGLRIGVDDAGHRLVVRFASARRGCSPRRRHPRTRRRGSAARCPVTSPIAHSRSPARRRASTADPVAVGVDPDGLEADARPRADASRWPRAAGRRAARGRRRASATKSSPSRWRRRWSVHRSRARCRRGAAPRRAPHRAVPARGAIRCSAPSTRTTVAAEPTDGLRRARRRPRRRRGRAAVAEPPSCWWPRGCPRRRRARAGRESAGRTGAAPFASTTCSAVCAAPSTSTVPVPASRPAPRSRSMPRSASQRSWPASE